MINHASTLSKVRWAFILVFLLITLINNYIETGPLKDAMPILSVLSIFVPVYLNGKERYGNKNMVIFFLITWLVSNFFEALSIQIGFPFGHYYYDRLIGPRIFQVPVIIMFAYFAMGYASWILSNVLLGQYSQKLTGNRIFWVPFVATFLMVMWDLCMDPISSSIESMWVWRDGGPYFGVPLQNYFGWFFVVYIILQLFALYISRYDVDASERWPILSRKLFWMESVAIYGIQALSQLLNPLTESDHLEIYGPMALITIFTMVFATVISFFSIKYSVASQWAAVYPVHLRRIYS